MLNIRNNKQISKERYRWLPTITGIFVTSLIISNIIAVKLVSLGPFILPVAILVFPISYIFGDIMTEVYGYASARRVIWIGFFCNMLAVIVIWISIQLPPSPFWNLGEFQSSAEAQKAYIAVLSFAPRLLAASLVAYLFGEFVNSYVLAKLKILTVGKHLWFRTIGSTIIGQLVDSSIFIFIAFYGIISLDGLFKIIVSQWIMKSIYEAAATPMTYIIVGYLKNSEKEDHYDYKTNFNPFAR